MRCGSGFPAWSKKWVLVGNSIKNGPLYQEFCDFSQYKSIRRAFPAQFQKSFTIRADLSKTALATTQIAFPHVRFDVEGCVLPNSGTARYRILTCRHSTLHP